MVQNNMLEIATSEPPGVPPQVVFEHRLGAWWSAHLRSGPARSYPIAWRLPDLARHVGAEASARARHALALTLYTLGRFEEAKNTLVGPHDANLDPAASSPATQFLMARCLCVQGQVTTGSALAMSALDQAPADPIALLETTYLRFLLDDASATLALCRRHGEIARSAPDGTRWVSLLDYWARARLALPTPGGPAHAAMAGLSTSMPALAALAQAIHAEAMFHQAPAWGQVWLDLALEACERLGQHHCKTRLLVLKSRALEAAGQLREADRFHQLAHALARRQGAWLYLDAAAHEI